MRTLDYDTLNLIINEIQKLNKKLDVTDQILAHVTSIHAMFYISLVLAGFIIIWTILYRVVRKF